MAIGFTMVNEAHAATKKVSMKLSSGATYYGEVKNGKPHGKGTARWGKEKTYSGDWVTGKRSGQGKYVYYTHSKEDLSEDMIYEQATSLTYTGSWENDKYHGEGKEFYQSIIKESLYENGSYRETFSDPINRITEGYFSNGKFKSGYSATTSREFNNLSFVSDKVEIQLNDFGHGSKIKELGTYSIPDVEYKIKKNNVINVVGISQSYTYKGTTQGDKFTGVKYVKDKFNWDTRMDDFSEIRVVKDLETSSKNIDYNNFEKKSREMLKSILKSIDPHIPRLEKISKELLQLRAII